MRVTLLIIGLSLFCLSCYDSSQIYTIAGSIEEPQNAISQTIAEIINQNLSDSIIIRPGLGSLSNLDSVANDKIDLAIVDNFVQYSNGVSAIYPVYPQILHVLHKKDFTPQSFYDLVKGRKVFAGTVGSGSYRLLTKLLVELNIPTHDFEMLPASRLFEADVLFIFTDIIGYAELRDLEGYHFYSLDDASALGKGTLVEGICVRYPQLNPYIIPKNLYGDYNPEPILTISSDAILVCRQDLPSEFVYDLAKLLNEHRRELSKISPLLYAGLRDDFDTQSLSFPVHEGAKNFFERDEPTFWERYAELGGVVFSIIVALGSGFYTLSRIRDQKKKDHIDEYYTKLLRIRNKVAFIRTRKGAHALLARVKDIQEITLQLVIEEKLLANESFMIFLTLSRIIVDEIKERCDQLSIKL